MRFRLTLSGEYEIPDEKAFRIYVSTDPAACARIEKANRPSDLVEVFFGNVNNMTAEIRPA